MPWMQLWGLWNEKPYGKQGKKNLKGEKGVYKRKKKFRERTEEIIENKLKMER